MTDKIHVFEKAGLGKAPFRLSAIFERKFQAYTGAPVKPGGTCEYCGQGILVCCQITDAEGRTFEVGSDCVLKTGDTGLRKVVNEERNRKARERNAAKRENRRIAKLDAERAKYGGHTWHEIQKWIAEEDRVFAAAKRQPFAEKLLPLADALADGKGGFCDSMAADMRQGKTPKGRGIFLVCDILAKRQGRRNSKAYETEYDRVENIIYEISEKEPIK